MHPRATRSTRSRQRHPGGRLGSAGLFKLIELSDRARFPDGRSQWHARKSSVTGRRPSCWRAGRRVRPRSTTGSRTTPKPRHCSRRIWARRSRGIGSRDLVGSADSGGCCWPRSPSVLPVRRRGYGTHDGGALGDSDVLGDASDPGVLARCPLERFRCCKGAYAVAGPPRPPRVNDRRSRFTGRGGAPYMEWSARTQVSRGRLDDARARGAGRRATRVAPTDPYARRSRRAPRPNRGDLNGNSAVSGAVLQTICDEDHHQ